MNLKSALLIAVWISAVGAGFFALTSYSVSAGDPGARVGASWPMDTKLARRGSGLYPLVVFLHPRCSCSLATLSELERLLALPEGAKIDLSLVFYRPKGSDASWVDDRVWKRAAQLPEHRTLVDEGGGEAARFGVLTSGQMILFSEAGKSVFKGGITPARGHTGDSAGRHSILGYLNQGGAEGSSLAETPVFGCRIGSL